MSQPATRHPPLTIEDYLALEETSSVRHEYVAGVLYALAGATRNHNLIIGNISQALRNTAQGGPYRVYTESVKLHAGKIVYYPDVMVVCEPPPENEYIEEAPCLVVEVTSRSTRTTDRREKAMVYRSIESVRAYVIVDQDRRRVERHWLEEDGTWWHADVSGSGRVPIPCPEITLTLDEIYAEIDLPG